jgi:Zn-dependent peptidase ImmA (M78 family)/DNA-binding XRE family transcriptional regulator
MTEPPPIPENVRRIRTSQGLTQQEVADRAGLSRVAFRDIETGRTLSPRVGTLQGIAIALRVGLDELLAPPPRLAAARFRSLRLRARKERAQREQIVFRVARWLEDFGALEGLLDDRCPYRLAPVAQEARSLPIKGRPQRVAAMARAALGLREDEPVRDICGLLEAAGVKVCLLESELDGFFGLSVAEEDGGPAVVVNVAGRIPVERQIFTSAHELGHLLLHPGAYDSDKVAEAPAEEREADSFAGCFLVPPQAFEKEWAGTRGLHFVERVLHVKRLFRVSYKVVLHRLVDLRLASDQIWPQFAAEYKRRYRKSLGGKEEPCPLAPADFVEDRLSRMVRRAVEGGGITLSRAAEILCVDLHAMRQRVASWDIAA